MDLLQVGLKLGPPYRASWSLDCFELALDVRLLDMQASPYDLSAHGEPAVADRDAEPARREYVARQRALAERAPPSCAPGSSRSATGLLRG